MSAKPWPIRRKVERIGRELLPENLRSFTMILASGKMTVVSTYDASTYGLGLTVPLKAELMKGQTHVSLYPEDDSFCLDGYVVFVIPDGAGRCRVGVQFGRLQSGEKYLEILPTRDEK